MAEAADRLRRTLAAASAGHFCETGDCLLCPGPVRHLTTEDETEMPSARVTIAIVALFIVATVIFLAWIGPPNVR